MNYHFAKVLYEHLGNMDITSYKETAYEMIEYGRIHLGNERFSKYHYNCAVEVMKLLSKKYGKNQCLPWDDKELDKELHWKKDIKKNQCIFLTFLIMEMQEGDKKECKDTNSYRREYVEVLNSFYKASGWDVLINDSMDQAILYFSLATHQTWTQWVDLQTEWEMHRKSDKDWKQKHSQWRFLEYSEFKRKVEEGLKEDSSKTQSTYLEADEAILEFIDTYNEDNHKKETNGKDRGLLHVSDVFPEDIQKVIEHAEWRRAWYLYRMVFMGIDCQIEKILKQVEEVKEYRSKENEEALRRALDQCWLRTNYVKALDKILSAADAEMAEKEIREYLNGCLITVENIANTFNKILSANKEPVFVQPKYRFAYHFPEVVQAYLKDPKRKVHREILRQYYKSDEEIEETGQNARLAYERNARLFSQLLSGETATSKEMLLLMALIIKLQGSKEINKEYVSQHVLKNCRFDIDIEEENPFEQFYLETFSNISSLQENAMKLEKEMLEQGRGAIFYNIVRGKEV